MSSTGAVTVLNVENANLDAIWETMKKTNSNIPCSTYLLAVDIKSKQLIHSCHVFLASKSSSSHLKPFTFRLLLMLKIRGT